MFSVRTEPTKSERVENISVLSRACVYSNRSVLILLCVSLCFFPLDFLFYVQRRTKEEKLQHFATAIRPVSNWNQSVCLLLFVILFIILQPQSDYKSLSLCVCVCLFNCKPFNSTETILPHTLPCTHRPNSILNRTLPIYAVTVSVYVTFCFSSIKWKVEKKTSFFIIM